MTGNRPGVTASKREPIGNQENRNRGADVDRDYDMYENLGPIRMASPRAFVRAPRTNSRGMGVRSFAPQNGLQHDFPHELGSRCARQWRRVSRWSRRLWEAFPKSSETESMGSSRGGFSERAPRCGRSNRLRPKEVHCDGRIGGGSDLGRLRREDDLRAGARSPGDRRSEPVLIAGTRPDPRTSRTPWRFVPR